MINFNDLTADEKELFNIYKELVGKKNNSLIGKQNEENRRNMVFQKIASNKEQLARFDAEYAEKRKKITDNIDIMELSIEMSDKYLDYLSKKSEKVDNEISEFFDKNNVSDSLKEFLTSKK